MNLPIYANDVSHDFCNKPDLHFGIFLGLPAAVNLVVSASIADSLCIPALAVEEGTYALSTSTVSPTRFGYVTEEPRKVENVRFWYF